MRESGGISSQLAQSKREALAQLEQQTRQNMRQKKLVFGEGNPDAKLVMVGEAPGGEEEKRGRPFVGRAGQLLDQFLEECSFERNELWITNVVKWHPTASADGRQRTRAPNRAEIDLHVGWLMKELEIICPKIILCLGNISAKALIDRRFKMTSEHGQWREGPFGIVAVATFHPAYVLRQIGRRDLVEQWVRQDLEKVKERYEQPDE